MDLDFSAYRHEANAEHESRALMLPVQTSVSRVSKNMERNTLYSEFAPLVRRLIRQYGQTPELRQDLPGEIYGRFCQLLENYDPQFGVPLRPYLVRQLSAAVYLYARQNWRVAKREVLLANGPESAPTAVGVDPTPGWDTTMAQQQIAEVLPDAISRLPRRQRQVVIWRYYEDRDFEEMARLMEVKPSTVRSLLRHGLNNLRQRMEIS